MAKSLQDVEMPYFNVHQSITVSETQSTDNKTYRLSKFQQSPPASALMELDMSINKGVSQIDVSYYQRYNEKLTEGN